MSDFWIQTYPSNTRFDLWEPRAADVHPRDVAHHLGRLCRFTGGVGQIYSVAQHCVLVSQAIEEKCRTEPAYTPEDVRVLALAGLVHDAAEAYTGDVSSPLKRLLRHLTPDQGYGFKLSVLDEVEERIERAVAERFGVPYPWPAIVKHYDNVLCATEKRDLLGPEPAPWSLPAECPPHDGMIVVWNSWAASFMWEDRFKELGGAL